MFISPTEPKELRDLGVTTLLPEEMGADIYFESELGKVGVQRKVFPGDFLASVHDGRLAKEYQQMRVLDLAILLLEGRAYWTTEGNLVRDRGGKRTAWTKTQHRNYLLSVQMRGIAVVYTDDLADTISYLSALRVWADKPDHTSLDVRPGPRGDAWGTLANSDYQEHVLQGFPGIGPKQARAICQHIGFPLALTATDEQLLTVPGIGKGKVKKLREVFGHGRDTPDSV